MEITLTTPALLFPAISLLLLAYTNRFVALAKIIRDLHTNHKIKPDSTILGQIKNLRYRIILIRNMQACGVFSLFLCSLAMIYLYFQHYQLGCDAFGLSLAFLTLSLAISIWEIMISVEALKLHLQDIEKDLE